MQYWLMKSEPDMFSIDDLKQRPKQTEHWDGVRNFQARNMLRNDMQEGDLAFFYHSSCQPPGIVGIMKIVKAGYPDFTAFDKHHEHYDPKSNPEKPMWYMVDVKFLKKFSHMITLESLKQHSELKNMTLLRKGNRLSVMPVSESEWEFIINLAK